MRSFQHRVTWLMLVCFSLQVFSPNSAVADDFFGRFGRMFKETYHGTPPQVCCDGAVECLAENIDWLEHHIDRYGSIVAKQPDIWGEARLTKHRDEYERMMYRELNQFEFKLNAAITQSDSSFLAQALALSEAASGSTPSVPEIVEGRQAQNNVVSILHPLTEAGAVNTNLSADFVDEGDKLDIEPTIYLDQMSRYLNHLHELRRINEGDDTSDSPGYSMNLVRIPISVLPGKLTYSGFGAEITVTAKPHLSDDLLPATFRNLVINDLVDQMGLPIVRVAEMLPGEEANLEALEDSKQKKEDLAAGIDLLTDAKRDFELFNFLEDSRADVTRVVKNLLDNQFIRESFMVAAQNAHTVALCVESSQEACLDNLKPDAKEFFLIMKTSYEEAVKTEAGKEAWKSRKDFYKTVSDDLRYYSHPEFKQQVVRQIVDRVIEIGEAGYRLDQEQAAVEEENSTDTHDIEENQQGSNSGELLGPRFASSADKRKATVEFQKLRNQAKSQQQSIEWLLQTAGDKNLVSPEQSNQYESSNRAFKEVADPLIAAINVALENAKPDLAKQVEELEGTEINALRIGSATAAASSPTGRTRRAAHPLPPSQIDDVFGWESLKDLAQAFDTAYYGRYVRWKGDKDRRGTVHDICTEHRVDLLDARKWLRAELAAAHDLLSRDQHLWLWHTLARPDSGLANAIRAGHIGPSEEDFCAPTPEEGELLPQSLENYDALDPPKFGTVDDYRRTFFQNLHRDPASGKAHYSPRKCEKTSTEILAWAIVIESALLNERLNEDIRKTAIAKGCYCMGISDRDLTFFLPEKAGREDSPFSEEFYTATKAFQEYVNCRWPVHVFAVDPREQDQNVADVSARKRELQFALAVGFVNGQIGGNSLTQYSRTMETQIETISLNRTIVGFGHGTDTFGWRFYPRVQALEVPGALGTVWQSVAGVDRDHDVCHRNLEPGMRECVAIVLMPSFVPYCDFTTRSNWFRLTNPKNSALTMKHTMRLSKAITAMRKSKAQCARCAHCYRPGEIEHLMTRVEQLDRELPLQKMRALVPYENTLGGFEMFNTGVTDLSPELIGWYGAPGVVIAPCDQPFACGCFDGCSLNSTSTCGKVDASADINAKFNTLTQKIDKLTTRVQEHTSKHPTTGPDKYPPLAACEGAGTTLFLVGDNFSVHDTKVIAGGVCIPHTRLVSREILRVTIPSCVNTVKLCENGNECEYVAIYLATPYGVTNHLHVPICRRDSECSSCRRKINSVGGADPKTPDPQQLLNPPLAPDPAEENHSTHLLIPLPPVEASHFRTVAMENHDPNGLIKLTSDLVAASKNFSDAAKAQALQPQEVIVNVQSAEARTQPVVQAHHQKHCDAPLVKQMHTRVKECWHNVRDKLPCY